MRLASQKITTEARSFDELASYLLNMVRSDVETAALFAAGSREPELWVTSTIQRAYYDFAKDNILALDTWKDGTWKTLVKRGNPVAFNGPAWAERFSEEYADRVFDNIEQQSGKRDVPITLNESDKTRLQPILRSIVMRKTSAGFSFHDEAVVFFLKNVVAEMRVKAGIEKTHTHRVKLVTGNVTAAVAMKFLNDAQADMKFRELYERDFRDENGSTANILFLSDFARPAGFRPPRPSIDDEFKEAVTAEREQRAILNAQKAVAPAPTSPATTDDTPVVTDEAPKATASLPTSLALIEQARAMLDSLKVFRRKGTAADTAFKQRLLANLMASKTVSADAKKGKDGIKKIDAARADIPAIVTELVEAGRVPVLSFVAAAQKIIRAKPFVDRMLKAHAFLMDHAKLDMKNRSDKAELAKRIAKLQSIYADYVSETTEANVSMTPALLKRLNDLEAAMAAGYPSDVKKTAAPADEKPIAKAKSKKADKAPAEKPATKKAAKKPAAKSAAKSAKKSSAKAKAKAPAKAAKAKTKAKAKAKAPAKKPAKKPAKPAKAKAKSKAAKKSSKK